MTNPGSIPLRERESLAEVYDSFKKLIPAGAPEVQQIEMRRAWYAGAAAMMSLIVRNLDVDSEPTELDLAYMESIQGELSQFSKDLGEGRA